MSYAAPSAFQLPKARSTAVFRLIPELYRRLRRALLAFRVLHLRSVILTRCRLLAILTGRRRAILLALLVFLRWQDAVVAAPLDRRRPRGRLVGLDLCVLILAAAGSEDSDASHNYQEMSSQGLALDVCHCCLHWIRKRNTGVC
jgi:hypothetical protein